MVKKMTANKILNNKFFMINKFENVNGTQMNTVCGVSHTELGRHSYVQSGI